MTALIALMLALAPAADDPAGQAILDSVVSVMGRVRDFTVSLEILADIERMSVPPMEATLYYKHPDRVHVEADGVAMIPREVLPMAIAALPQKFSVERVERDTLRDKEIVRLSLKPRHASARTRSLTLAVDPDRWLPLEFASSTVGGRAVTAEFEFAEVDGFWLPAAVEIRLDAVPEDTTDVPAWEQGSPGGRRGGVPRRGTIRIVYRDYRINTGLPEEMFAPRTGAEGLPEQRD